MKKLLTIAIVLFFLSCNNEEGQPDTYPPMYSLRMDSVKVDSIIYNPIKMK